MARFLFTARPDSQPAGYIALGRVSIPYPLQPPLLLLLLTLLALGLAYTTRPTVQIDVGTYYDAAYLRGFHDREVSAVGAGQAWDWPADSNTLTLPGGLSGEWVATVFAREELPGRPLSGVALLVNEQYVTIPRDSSHQFTAFLPAEMAAEDPLRLRLIGTPRGTPDPEPGTVVRVTLEPARTYRWTQGAGSIRLPNVGRGPWHIDLDVIAAHPNAQPLQAEVLVNGAPLAALPESGTLRRISLLVPASLVDSGTLDITLRSNVYQDPRPLGLLVAEMTAAPLQRGGPPVLWLLPPWGALPASLTIVLGWYACLVLILRGNRFSLAAGLLPALAAALALALALWSARFPTAFMLSELAGLALWSILLVLALRPLLRWVLGEQPRFIALLLLIFFAGYWLKAGAMMYPYFIGIDISWHMDRVRWILDGALPLLYGTDSPLNEMTMPVAEWGSNPPVIPYSPYFHMFATIFALLPWSLEFSANMFSALLDSSRVLIIGVLADRLGLGQRGALLAALLMTVLPINFLLLSWGNIPTTVGLWWTCALTAFMLAAWPHLQQRVPFGVLTLLLLGALLFYTVAGAFTGLFLLCFTLALWLAVRSANLPRGLLAGIRPLWLATAAALALALLVYYGQYIPPIIERTLPYFAQIFTASREETGRVGDTWTAYLLRHTRLSYYGLVGPLLLTAVYLVREWAGRFRRGDTDSEQPEARASAVLLWAAVAAWVVVLLLFVPAGFKVSMVDKHFFVALPMLVVASAAVLAWLWQRGRLARWAIALYYGYLGVAALVLWVSRVSTVQQGW